MLVKFLLACSVLAGSLLNIGLHGPSASVRAETAPSSTNAPSSSKVELKEVKRQPLTPKQQAERDAALTKLGTITYRNEQLQPAKTIVPAAIPLLKHPDSEVRIMTTRLFQTLGRSAQDAIPHLIPLLQDKDVEVRTRVPFALAEMGDLAQDAVPQLKQMLHDPETAFAANWALWFVDRDTRTAQLQELLTGMQSTNTQTRNDARFALGLMQPKELKPQLTQLLKHKNPDIRQSAESILATLNAKNGTYIGRGLGDYLIVEGDRCRFNQGGALSPRQENCNLIQIDGDQLYDGDQQWSRVP